MSSAGLRDFVDASGASQHEALQSWRRLHPNGAVLSFGAKTRATLHRSSCPHFGDCQWSASKVGSLTKTLKLCADLPDPLLRWAFDRLVEVYDCSDCARMEAKGLVRVTAFSWGYAGWGNAVDRLLEAVDARERSRGFAPPAFADIRIRRSVRAAGFNGTAFETYLGPARHRWFQGLGNQSVATGETGIRIKDPAVAENLLEFIHEKAKEQRRVLFFCSCGPAKGCHRQVVADLLLAAANANGVALNVGEWPGDLPRVRRVSAADGRKWRYPGSLYLGVDLPSHGLATLPHGSIVLVQQDGRESAMVTGPAQYHSGWRLYPVKENALRAGPVSARRATPRRRRQQVQADGASHITVDPERTAMMLPSAPLQVLV